MHFRCDASVQLEVRIFECLNFFSIVCQQMSSEARFHDFIEVTKCILCWGARSRKTWWLRSNFRLELPVNDPPCCNSRQTWHCFGHSSASGQIFLRAVNMVFTEPVRRWNSGGGTTLTVGVECGTLPPKIGGWITLPCSWPSVSLNRIPKKDFSVILMFLVIQHNVTAAYEHCTTSMGEENYGTSIPKEDCTVSNQMLS